MHVCVGNTCVICSLSNTFTVFSNLTNSWSRDVVFFHYVEKTLGECRRYLHRDTSKFEVGLWTWSYTLVQEEGENFFV